MPDSDGSGSESASSVEESGGNPLVRAWDRLKSDVDTQQIREVIKVENGRPKIDPKKAKELAQSNNKWAVKGATGGAIAGAVISISGVLVIPGAAAGAALGYAIDRNAVDRVEELEEDFQTILEAIEDEEKVDLSRLAMITHIKKEILSDEYIPYLEDQGFVEFDDENNVVVFREPFIQRAMSYVRD